MRPHETHPSLINEMLDTLGSVTNGGRPHLMRKIVTALSLHPLAKRRGSSYAGTLEALSREAHRLAPDDRSFTHAARELIARQ
jgi:hypothetical protein